jgi:hypothetical protein
LRFTKTKFIFLVFLMVCEPGSLSCLVAHANFALTKLPAQETSIEVILDSRSPMTAGELSGRPDQAGASERRGARLQRMEDQRVDHAGGHQHQLTARLPILGDAIRFMGGRIRQTEKLSPGRRDVLPSSREQCLHFDFNTHTPSQFSPGGFAFMNSARSI